MNSKGMSLIEVIVASGVMLIVLTSFGAMMANSAKEQRKLTMNMEMNNIYTQLASSLAGDASCATMLGGKAFSSTTQTNISQIDLVGTPLSTATPFRGWKINSIALKPGAKLQDLVNGATTRGLYSASLDVDAERSDSSLGTGNRKLSIPVRIVTQTTPSTVLGCYGQQDLTTQACVALGGQYSPPPTGSPAGTTGTCVPTGTGTLEQIRKDAVTQTCQSLGPTVGINTAGTACTFVQGSFPAYVVSLVPTATPTPTGTPIDGNWSAWSACSATACGTTGTQTRTCNNPTPTNGGKVCTGLSSQSCSAPSCYYSGGNCTITCTPSKTYSQNVCVKPGAKGSCLQWENQIKSCNIVDCSKTLSAPALTTSPTTPLSGSCSTVVTCYGVAKAGTFCKQNAGGYSVDSTYQNNCEGTHTCTDSCTTTNTPAK